MEIYLKKLLFKASHRGTKEMDIILGSFAEKNLETMNLKDLLIQLKILGFLSKQLTFHFQDLLDTIKLLIANTKKKMNTNIKLAK